MPDQDLDEFDQLLSGAVPPKEATTAVVLQPRERQPNIAVREVPHLEAWARDETYKDISARPVTDEQAQALTDPLTDDEVDIKPDSFGAVYLGHHGYRRRLNKAFKPGGWALRRLTTYTFDNSQHIAYAEFALYAEGRFVGMATGEMRLPDHNDDMSKGDIIEGLKSNALMRACKDLGVATEAWDRKWTDSFRNRLCVRVWVKPPRADKPKMQWRRLDAPMFYGETGCTSDSPNRDKYEAAQKSPNATTQAPVSPLARLTEDQQARIARMFGILQTPPGEQTVRITEFLAKASKPEDGFEALLQWGKKQHEKQKAEKAVGGPTPPDSSKQPRSNGDPVKPVSGQEHLAKGSADLPPVTAAPAPMKPLDSKEALF